MSVINKSFPFKLITSITYSDYCRGHEKLQLILASGQYEDCEESERDFDSIWNKQATLELLKLQRIVKNSVIVSSYSVVRTLEYNLHSVVGESGKFYKQLKY